MAHDAHEHTVSFKIYYWVWFWLLILTLLALGLGYAPMPEGLKALLLVSITLGKIGLIAAFFMHLKFEKLNLIMITFTPLILAVILFFFTFPETSSSATHVISVR